MVSARGKLRDMLHLIRQGGPALCNIAITNSCNATCDFCNFANGKIARQQLVTSACLEANRFFILKYLESSARR